MSVHIFLRITVVFALVLVLSCASAFFSPTPDTTSKVVASNNAIAVSHQTVSDSLNMVEPVPFRVIAGGEGKIVRIPPPSRFKPDSPTASFSINYLAAGTADGQGATCLAWDPAAQAAFTYGVSIWATLIKSNVPIRINACWANLGSPTTLGYSWSSLTGNFGAGQTNTWYARALADALVGTDLHPGNPDMSITYNNGFAWYTGTDGNTPAGQYDLVSVVLHEVAHGLNFSGSMRWDNGSGTAECNGISGHGCWGYGTSYPNIYDRFTENGSNQALIDTGLFANPSAALGAQLVSGNLFFDGPNTDIANSGNPAKIYAPGTWTSGSSYSHLDYATFSGTANRLMVYAISSGSSIHDPGAVTMGLLSDLGWSPTYLVDDDFNSGMWGWNHTHFASIQNGINAIPANGTVMVAAGTYPETVTLNKNITTQLEGDIAVNGNLGISTGAFIATTGTLTLTTGFTQSGGTFTHNGGTVTFGGTTLQTLSGTPTFNNLIIAPGAKVFLAGTPFAAGTVDNSGEMSQTHTLNSGTNFNFLQISTNSYRGVDITATANLGQVSVIVRGNAAQCTTDAGSPNYRNRCIVVNAQNAGTANMVFYTTAAEDDVPAGDTLYRSTGGAWSAQAATCGGTAGDGCSSTGLNLSVGDNYFLIGGPSIPTALELTSLKVYSPPQSAGYVLVWGVGLIVLLGLAVKGRLKMSKG
ncbi:hypothetical protein TFLX_04272 [Thermoflexales bacterium]|nr:hypothetical protein TFLX_04272 [Thermoflexales bacterium]